MDKWILICGLKKQSIFPWGKMTLASLDSNDCLPLSSGSSPPNTVSAAWPVCDLRSVWLIDLQTLRSYKAPVPLAGGQSGPERFGCVLFLWDTPALTAPRESMTLTFHLLSPVLASGILSLSLTSKPCHGPEMLAAGCHFLPNGLTSWPRGVRGPPRHSKSQPHPWRMLGHPADSLRQGLQRPRTCPPPCHLCCWAVLSRVQLFATCVSTCIYSFNKSYWSSLSRFWSLPNQSAYCLPNSNFILEGRNQCWILKPNSLAEDCIHNVKTEAPSKNSTSGLILFTPLWQVYARIIVWLHT